MTDKTGLVPSCLIPEVYSAWKDEPGFVASQVEAIAAAGYYRAVELSPVALSQDRARIRSVCAEHGLDVATWLTSVLEQRGLDVCAVDEVVRLQSVEAIKCLLPTAVECGSRTVALVGGADPGPGLRQHGYDSAYESLVDICAEAANLGVSVMFEPLDRFAHKKRLVSFTEEAVALFARVRQEHPSFGFAFDTAHSALNEENILEALDLAKDQLVNLHLSNAVLDKNDPLYGDHHMMPGAPGFLTIAKAAEIIAKTRRVSPAASIRVAVEARAVATMGQQETAALALDFLQAAFAEAEKLQVEASAIAS